MTSAGNIPPSKTARTNAVHRQHTQLFAVTRSRLLQPGCATLALRRERVVSPCTSPLYSWTPSTTGSRLQDDVPVREEVRQDATAVLAV
jgi:hypothetical protein